LLFYGNSSSFPVDAALEEQWRLAVESRRLKWEENCSLSSEAVEKFIYSKRNTFFTMFCPPPGRECRYKKTEIKREPKPQSDSFKKVPSLPQLNKRPR
jgi:hypothetical protein